MKKGLRELSDLCKGPPSFGQNPARAPSLVGDHRHHLAAVDWWEANRARGGGEERVNLATLYYHRAAAAGGRERDALRWLGFATSDAVRDGDGSSLAAGRAHLLALHGTESPYGDDRPR